MVSKADRAIDAEIIDFEDVEATPPAEQPQREAEQINPNPGNVISIAKLPLNSTFAKISLPEGRDAEAVSSAKPPLTANDERRAQTTLFDVRAKFGESAMLLVERESAAKGIPVWEVANAMFADGTLQAGRSAH
ncbi:MAG: hypothetical protein IPN24_18420 [Betaproteobacteria bacterium]|nr:hypothetical protein [Betaproteobacteria bacterium]